MNGPFPHSTLPIPHLIRRGWCLGEETFRQELLARMSEPMGPEPYGQERALTAEARAEQIIAEEWQRRRWAPTGLQTRRKGDPAKVALAGRDNALPAGRQVTVGWMAERLAMGTRGHLNHLLYPLRKCGWK